MQVILEPQKVYWKEYIQFSEGFCLLACLLAFYAAYEVSWLGVKSELQLPAYTTATAVPDLSLVFDLRHSSRQHWFLNPLSKPRDGTHVLMDTSWVRYC